MQLVNMGLLLGPNHNRGVASDCPYRWLDQRGECCYDGFAFVGLMIVIMN